MHELSTQSIGSLGFVLPLNGATSQTEVIEELALARSTILGPLVEIIPGAQRLLTEEIRHTLRALESSKHLAVANSKTPLSLSNAQKIATLFSAVYGEGYVEPEFVDPTLLVEKVAQGKWQAFMIFDDQNHSELIAHAALLPQGDNIEFGRFLVTPKFQGRKLGKVVTAMTVLGLLESISQTNPAVFYEEAVTTKAASQVIFDQMGFKPNGLYLGKYTDFFGASVRESTLVLSQIIDPMVKDPKDCFIPNSLVNLAEVIFESLECERTIVTTDQVHVDFSSSDLDTISVDHSDREAFQISSLYVDQKNSPQTLIRTVNSEIAAGAKYISAKLDLSKASSVHQAQALLEFGFLFAAILPAKEKDTLVLQYLVDRSTIDLNNMQFAAPSGQELLGKILSSSPV